jgi:ATP-binding cassette subfamily B multidrug efflux pump
VTRDATVIVVAQRVSTIIDADQIIVLDDGRVVGSGRHTELLETCPTYQEIVVSQRAAEEAGGMSEGVKTAEEKAAERAARPAPHRRGGPPHMAMGMPGEKSQNFVPSAKRLFGLHGAASGPVVWASFCWSPRSWPSTVGPKILGQPPTSSSPGFFGARSRPGSPGAGHRRRCGPAAETRSPTCSRRWTRAGQGIDFDAVGPGAAARARDLRRRRASCGLQGPARPASCSARCTACARRRGQAGPAAAVLLRRPAARRAAQPGHQRHRQRRAEPAADPVQLLTSLLTVIAVLGMMFWISPAARAHRAGDGPGVDRVTAAIGKRSQKLFVQAVEATGELNAIIEETFTGHELVKVFGRQAEVERRPSPANDELLRRELRGAVHQRDHHADDDVRREPQLRRHRRRRRAAGGVGAMSSVTCRRSSSTPASSPSR